MARENGYKSTATQGVAWSSCGRVAVQLINIGSTAILARILAPADFGLLGMTAICLGFISMYREMGLATAIVREENPSHRLLSSIFWSNIALTVFIIGLTWIAAPLVATYFREPRVTAVLRVQSLGLAFSSIGMVQTALLWRRMAFRKLVFIDVGTACVGFVVSVGAALAGWGVWALVASSLVTAAASGAALCIVMRFKPAFTLCREDVRRVASFSFSLTGFNTVNYFARNGDNMLIGRYLGATPLAYYAIAYNLMLYPLQNVSQVVGRVLFPAFAAMQNDNARFRSAYLRSCSVIAAITFPIMAGMWLTSDLLVRAVYGQRWAPVAGVLAILAPVGLIQSLSTTVGQIYTAKGRADWLMWWGLGSSVFLICSFVIGLRWGITGVAAAYAIAMTIAAYPCFAIPFRLIELKVGELVISLARVAACSGVMLVVVSTLRALLKFAGANDFRVQLAATVTAGVASYLLMTLWLRPPIIWEIAELCSHRRFAGLLGLGCGAVADEQIPTGVE